MGTCAVEPRVAGHLRVMLLAQMFNNAQRRSLCCCNRHAAWRRISQAQRPVRASPGVSRPLLVCTAAEAVMGDKALFRALGEFVHPVRAQEIPSDRSIERAGTGSVLAPALASRTS